MMSQHIDFGSNVYRQPSAIVLYRRLPSQALHACATHPPRRLEGGVLLLGGGIPLCFGASASCHMGTRRHSRADVSVKSRGVARCFLHARSVRVWKHVAI